MGFFDGLVSSEHHDMIPHPEVERLVEEQKRKERFARLFDRQREIELAEQLLDVLRKLADQTGQSTRTETAASKLDGTRLRR